MKTPGSLLLYGLVTFYPETWKFLARLNLAMFTDTEGNIGIICFWNLIEVTDPELLQKKN
jgi:hypothetical protein